MTPSYQEMKQFVKQRRVEAVQNDEEGILEIIGNYTLLNYEEMKNVYDMLQGMDEVCIFCYVEELENRIVGLENRLIILESKLI